LVNTERKMISTPDLIRNPKEKVMIRKKKKGKPET